MRKIDARKLPRVKTVADRVRIYQRMAYELMETAESATNARVQTDAFKEVRQVLSAVREEYAPSVMADQIAKAEELDTRLRRLMSGGSHDADADEAVDEGAGAPGVTH